MPLQKRTKLLDIKKGTVAFLWKEIGSTQTFQVFSTCSKLLNQNTHLGFCIHHKEMKVRGGSKTALSSFQIQLRTQQDVSVLDLESSPLWQKKQRSTALPKPELLTSPHMDRACFTTIRSSAGIK